MPAYRHIIWDWNGTLFDDVGVCVDILNDLLRRRGRPPITAAQYADQFGFPVEAFYRAIGFDFEAEPYPDVAHAFMAVYDERRLACGLRAGAREALAAFADLGLAQSVLSAYRQRSLEELVDHFDVRRYFQVLCGLDDHLAAGKLENGRRLAATLACAPAEALLVGDTTHDAEVARAAGLACVLIPSGHQSVPRLTATGAPVLNGLPALVAHVREPHRPPAGGHQT
jgi:phosphoglycolate phosphatase